MSSDPQTTQPLEEIRGLLLTPDALIDKITPVIAQILEEHITASRDDMAKVIAPIIGEAIRRQVYEAREDIVDALYPVIGQTINKAIAEAMRDLARTVDVRMRQGMLSQNQIRYWKARLSGVSKRDYQLRLAIPFLIREIFVIQRATGILICHLSYGENLLDRDMASGMLTAIRDFARDIFDHGNKGEVGTISYETQNILLEAGGVIYIAVVVDGVEPGVLREDMRRIVITLHEQYYERLKYFNGSDTDLEQKISHLLQQMFPAPTHASSADSGPLSGFQRFIVAAIVTLMLLPPLLGCSWWIWHVEHKLTLLAAIPATATSIPTLTSTPRPTATSVPTMTPAPTRTPVVLPTAIPPVGVMIGNVYLRADPLRDASRTNLVAPLGAQVTVLAQDGDWYRVRVAITEQSEVEMIGWVPTNWVRVLEPVPVTLITPTVGP